MSGLSRRRFAALALGGGAALAGAIAQASIAPPQDALEADVGAMLMLGFFGASPASPTARALAGAIAAGRAAGVLFVRENVGTRAALEGLVRLFREASTPPPLIAIDHEGGAVQRLTGRHGFTPLPPPRRVARTLSPDAAGRLYARAAREFASLGFNLNLAPVVDLDDPGNPAVGRFGRAFADDPETVARYAAAFVGAYAGEGVACAPKHFPGYGRARLDSHFALPDVTRRWSATELTPYARLIASGEARVVMAGHERLAAFGAEDAPSSLSRAVMTGLLREGLKFEGVAMTDDLDMAAVSARFSKREALIRAIAAGADVAMIRNADAPDPHLPLNAARWLAAASAQGEVRADALAVSAARVRRLRTGLARAG